jgi:hypothetical protein
MCHTPAGALLVKERIYQHTRAGAPQKKEWDELCKDDSQDGPNCHTDTGHNAQVATTKGKNPFHNPHV